MEEVPDIITEDERRAFLELGTEEEREQFIEIFGGIAIPTTNHPSTLPGKSTTVASLTPTNTSPPASPAARPTAVASTSSGVRPMKSNLIPLAAPSIVLLSRAVALRPTYPWELWRYRHLEGIGENIESNLSTLPVQRYHITKDPCEKDALVTFPAQARV